MQELLVNKRILAIGDSLALPGHGNKYEDTWIYKLKNGFPQYDFITFFKRQLTTHELVSMGGGEAGSDKKPKGADCLEFFKPNVIILQLGIVDCAPRLLFDLERKIVSKLPTIIATPYINLIKLIRKRKTYNTLVPINRFKFNLETYFQRCIKENVQKVIIITISFPDEKMVKKNPDIGVNVDSYNNLFFEFAMKYDFITIITPLDSRNYKEKIFEDGYHPNIYGNDLVFKSLLESIG